MHVNCKCKRRSPHAQLPRTRARLGSACTKVGMGDDNIISVTCAMPGDQRIASPDGM